MRKLNTPSVKTLKACILFNINSNLLHRALGLIAYSESRTKNSYYFHTLHTKQLASPEINKSNI